MIRSGYPAGCGVLRRTAGLTDQLRAIEGRLDSIEKDMAQGRLADDEIAQVQAEVAEIQASLNELPPFRGLSGSKERVVEQADKIQAALAGHFA